MLLLSLFVVTGCSDAAVQVQDDSGATVEDASADDVHADAAVVDVAPPPIDASVHSGDVDPSFHGPSTTLPIDAIALENDAIVYPNGDHLVRLLADGTADGSFGNATPIAGTVTAVTVVSGKLAACGSGDNGLGVITSLFDANGALLGSVPATHGTDNGSCSAIAASTSGNIASAVSFANGATPRVFEYDITGKLVHTISLSYPVTDVAYDGSLILAVQRSATPKISRFNSTGLDAAFGSGGIATISLAPSGYSAGDCYVTVDSGSYLLACNAISGTKGALVVTRLSNAGAVDASFGQNGFAVLDVGSSAYGNGSRVVVDASKRILAAITDATSTSAHNMGVARWLTNGQPDTSFGDTGVALVTTAKSGGYVLAIQSTGRIVVGGAQGASALIERLFP